MAAAKSGGIKFKVMCRVCKTFYMVYPKHNQLCEPCREKAIKSWTAAAKERDKEERALKAKK